MAQLKNLLVEGDSRLIGEVNAGDIIATKIKKQGGTSSQFLKADGSVDSNAYATTTFVNGAITSVDKVFIATYGTTTFADIETAHNAGKAVFMQYPYSNIIDQNDEEWWIGPDDNICPIVPIESIYSEGEICFTYSTYGMNENASLKENIVIRFIVSIDNSWSVFVYRNVFIPGAGTNSVQQKGTGAAASGVGAVAEGNSTVAYGTNSHAEGNSTFANGQNSHAEGSGTIADGVTSHAEGVSNTTMNEGEHSEGKYNITIQNKTIHTVGVGNKTNNVITRKNGHLIDVDGKHYIPGIGGYHGTETVFTNIKDLATVITEIPVEKGTGTNSVQQKGSGASASGNNSYAEGGSTAKAQRSHAEGNGCTAETTATNSHVEGYQNTVNGVASHAEGRNNTTTNEAEHAEGKYNVSISGVTLHTVGIGTSASKKKNAHIITTDGKHYIPGVGGYTGTETSLSGKTDLATVVNSLDNVFIATYGNGNTTYDSIRSAYSAGKTVFLKVPSVSEINGWIFNNGDGFSPVIPLEACYYDEDYPSWNYASFTYTTVGNKDGYDENTQVVIKCTVMGDGRGWSMTVYPNESDIKPCKNVTWSQLRSLRNQSKLIPGMQYRITDYVTSTGQTYTGSHGDPFDIIVFADNRNTLNENARAVSHINYNLESESTIDYFTDECGYKVNAWKLKYCLDNDFERFAWARTITPGKVLFNNEWYTYTGNDVHNGDFDVECREYSSGNADDGISVIYVPVESEYSDDVFETYGNAVYDESDNFIGYDDGFRNIGVVQMRIDASTYEGKGVIYWMKDEFNNEAPYDFKNIQFTFNSESSNPYYTFDCGDNRYDKGKYCNNTIKPYYLYQGQMALNFVAFYGSKICNNVVGEGCHDILFGAGQTSGIESTCCDNIIGNESCGIRFGVGCSDNRIGNRCYTIMGGDVNKHITIGDDCKYIYFNSGSDSYGFGSTYRRGYYQYITVEPLNHLIKLNAGTTTAANRIFRKITISSGFYTNISLPPTTDYNRLLISDIGEAPLPRPYVITNDAGTSSSSYNQTNLTIYKRNTSSGGPNTITK